MLFDYKQYCNTNISIPFDMFPVLFCPHNKQLDHKIPFSYCFPKAGRHKRSYRPKHAPPFLCSWLPEILNLLAAQSSEIFITPLVLPHRRQIISTLSAVEMDSE